MLLLTRHITPLKDFHVVFPSPAISLLRCVTVTRTRASHEVNISILLNCWLFWCGSLELKRTLSQIRFDCSSIVENVTLIVVVFSHIWESEADDSHFCLSTECLLPVCSMWNKLHLNVLLQPYTRPQMLSYTYKILLLLLPCFPWEESQFPFRK